MEPVERSRLDVRSEHQLLNATKLMAEAVSTIRASDRSSLRFVEKVRNAFEFLNELGFSETETLSTLVRYKKRRC